MQEMTIPGIRSSVIAVLSVAIACCAGAGCSQYLGPNLPEPIRRFVEPESGREYQVYRPSSYEHQKAWPLIVVCHTSLPDSPNRQIRDWAELAEAFGFLVVAPRLKGTRKAWPPRRDVQLARQRADEEHILAVIRHVRAGHNVSDDRILIYGRSGGAYAALPVGLRHPEVFRAVSLAQPRFKSDYLADVGEVLDPYQPIYVIYSLSDVLTGKHARRCVDWLKAHAANLRENPSGSNRKADCRGVVEFLEDTIRKEPWIRIRAFPVREENPFTIQFKLRCSYQPTEYHWEFGDADESQVAEPIHVYAAPGIYNVAVTVDGPNHRPLRRSVTVKVPAFRARPTSRPSGQAP